jgi:hypothetical protein
MPTRRARSPRRRTRRAAGRTARSVRAAAVRAVEQVLSSDAAFALLVRRLEEAGWRVEREPRAKAAAPGEARSARGEH